MTGNQQLGIRKNAEKSYGDFLAFLCGREEKVKLYLYSLCRGGNDDIPTS